MKVLAKLWAVLFMAHVLGFTWLWLLKRQLDLWVWIMDLDPGRDLLFLNIWSLCALVVVSGLWVILQLVALIEGLWLKKSCIALVVLWLPLLFPLGVGVALTAMLVGFTYWLFSNE